VPRPEMPSEFLALLRLGNPVAGSASTVHLEDFSSPMVIKEVGGVSARS
jgi:hypothetical protein